MIAVLDVETTTANKGNPYTQGNYVVLGGLYDGKEPYYFTWQTPTSDIENYLRRVKLLVLFNGKFDLAWLLNMGVVIPPTLRIWDCQLYEFFKSNQKWKYPDLDESLNLYGFALKEHIVRDLYWNQGVDTIFVPPNILQTYLQRDLEGTWELQNAQQQDSGRHSWYRLFRVACADQLVLLQMEWNGVKYDTEESLKRGMVLGNEVQSIDKELSSLLPPAPISFSSNDHKSVVLYGGSIVVDDHLPIGFFKTGAKIGQPRYKVVKQVYEFPRLVQPLEGSKLAKDGYFSTDEGTLRNLNAKGPAKKIIELLLKRSKLEKLRGTYYEGLPKRIENSGWLSGELHGQYNQCVVITGRLSSDKPNLQNIPGEVKELCISRYD